MQAVFVPDPAGRPAWRCRSLRPVPRAPAGRCTATRRSHHGVVQHARAAGGRSPLRPPDATLEPQDAPLHLHRARWDLHHRPPADAGAAAGGHDFARNVAERNGTVLFVGTKKQAQDAISERGGARRHAVREPPLARRPAHELAHDVEPDRAPPRAAPPQVRGPARAAPVEGAHLHARPSSRSSRQNLGGVADMRRQPDAVFIVDLRKEQLAVSEARRLGMPVIALVDTNCRPGRGRLRHPGQRRRDPLPASLIMRVIADGVVAGQAARHAAGDGRAAARAPGRGAPPRTVSRRRLPRRSQRPPRSPKPRSPPSRPRLRQRPSPRRRPRSRPRCPPSRRRPPRPRPRPRRRARWRRSPRPRQGAPRARPARG